MQKGGLKEVLYEGIHCSLKIERPSRGMVVLRFSGHDVGELGDAPFQELAKDLGGGGLIELFIDARNSQGASINVSNDWAQWLRAHRKRFRLISMLTRTRFIQITAKFVRRFAELDDLMRIYTDPTAFDDALSDALAKKRALSSPPDVMPRPCPTVNLAGCVVLFVVITPGDATPRPQAPNRRPRGIAPHEGSDRL